MWALNLCLPGGFLIFVLGVIGMFDLIRAPEPEIGQPARDETTGNADDAVVASREGSSLCRPIITVVFLLTGAVLGCVLLGCLSTRASTYMVAFMLATLGMTCERIIPRD